MPSKDWKLKKCLQILLISSRTIMFLSMITYNILLLHHCVLFYQLSKLGQSLPRQLGLFYQTLLGMVNMTIGNARDTEALVEIDIRICDGNIQEYCVGIGRCQFVVRWAKSMTCLCEIIGGICCQSRHRKRRNSNNAKNNYHLLTLHHVAKNLTTINLFISLPSSISFEKSSKETAILTFSGLHVFFFVEG